MSDKQKVIRVFIGSPGGLDEERRAAHEVVESVNRSHSENWGCHFKLFGWENAVPGYVRPQSKINEDLDRCDYFIGVLWNKWGSSPSTDLSGYTSGFEEEYERSEARIKSGLMKDMAIYFKDINVPIGMEPGEEIRKVFEFRKKCIEEKRVFFKPFTDVQSFRNVVREKLEEIGWQETEIFSQESRQNAQSDKTPSNQTTSEETQKDERLIDEEARNFLIEITQRPPIWESTAAHEIARLRLIGTAVARSGNDAFYLGNHDANLVFKHLRDFPLSDQETQALLDCGVVSFTHQNVPLWKWVARHELGEDSFYRLRILATVGNNRERKNAIRILELLQQPIPTHDGYYNKHGVLTDWFAENTEDQVFAAAISFLTANGTTDDIPFIETASTNCTPYRKNQIEGAIVAIVARTNVDTALQRLCEKEVDKIEGAVIRKLFQSPQSLSTETLTMCLSAKPEDVRLQAAQILLSRGELSADAAHTLLTDNSHETRLIAAEALRNLGQPLGDDVLEKALRIESKSVGFGFLRRTETDSSYLERYRANRLSELSAEELKKKIDENVIFVDRELAVFYSKFRHNTAPEMRKNLTDGFNAHFDSQVEKARTRLGSDPATITEIEKLGMFHRTMLCSNTVAALCELRKSSDLKLVRKVIDNFDIAASESVLTYLARFGEWQDIRRIIKLVGFPNDRSGRFRINATQLPKQKADAIFILGKQRIADLLALDLDGNIRISLLKRLPNKIFNGLNDTLLLRELARKDDESRIIFALRCVQSLSKSRITSLLNLYIDSAEHRYYNSIHWLDLGASLPRQMAKSVAERELLQHG